MQRTSTLSFSLLVSLGLLTGCYIDIGLSRGDSPTDATDEDDVASDDDDAASDDDDASTLSYPIVDTAQSTCYDTADTIACPSATDHNHGQDAQYAGFQPFYVDNGDGTVSDLVTGLMWQQDPGAKMTWDAAVAGAESSSLGGYTDWRLPTIKEQYSLIQFDGTDPSTCANNPQCNPVPFIDGVFAFQYGDESAGERMIDAQYATSSLYEGAQDLMFGVNFADGRIKGYGTDPMPGQTEDKTFFVMYVRGNSEYGVNDFEDNGDGTVSDLATGLTWLQDDSGGLDGAAGFLDWPEALAWAEDLEFAGHDDWRLPNAKELQSIVDYTRAPSATNSAAIDPIFDATEIIDEDGGDNYGFYWTSTTHAAEDGSGGSGAYMVFGEGLGWMQPPGGGDYNLIDIHGAGCQRSDPKVGDPTDWPYGHGPQGDVIRIYNLVRPVRDAVMAGAPGDDDDTVGDDDDTVGDDDDTVGDDDDDLGDDDDSVGDDDDSVGDDDDAVGDDDDGPNMPPQEAINACSGSNEGDSCQFVGAQGQTVVGTCLTVVNVLACVPEGGPPPQ